MVSVMVAERRPRQARSLDLLSGHRLEYVRLGHAIVLGFSGGRQVVIETLMRLDGPGGPVEVEPGENPSDAVGTLLGDVVRSARAHDDGELQLTFGCGARLRVGADADFESWAVTGPSGFLVVCLARGEVAVWGDAGSSVEGHLRG